VSHALQVTLCNLEPAGTGTVRQSCISRLALQLATRAVHSSAAAAARVSAGRDIFKNLLKA